MHRLYIKLSGLLFALAFMFSCTTDFETIAAYKDITVVYCLLDQTQADQYLKINKAFLSENDVLIYANEADSSNYPYKLDIKLEEWDEDGNYIQSFNFDTTTIYNKEPGQFYNPEQILYKWIRPEYPISYEIIYWGQAPIDTISVWLNTDNTYKLSIKNPETEKEISSETKMVDHFTVKQPSPLTSVIKFISDQGNTRNFEWENGENATKYEVKMLFHYFEVNDLADTTETYIKVWERSVNAQTGDNEVSVTFADDQFFSACNSSIPYSDASIENKITSRISYLIEIKISAAEKNFAIYLEVNKPSTSIVQDKPQYTNILNENGEVSNDALGIFSSRAHTKTFKKVHVHSMNELKSIYPHLKFAF